MGKQSAAIGEKLRRGAAKACTALVLEVNRELRRRPPLGTPVQDGNARANWVPSVGAPSSVDAGDAAAGNAANASGVAQVLSYKLGQGDLFIVNRTPYIKRLNDGWSKQSPALFVEAAVERAKTKVQAMLRASGSGIDLGGMGLGADQSASDVAGDMASNLADAFNPLGSGGGSDD